MNIIKRYQSIKLVITDVDGVLTDGGVYCDQNGNELLKFNIRDGVGVALLKLAGIDVGLITTSSLQITKHRIKRLGFNFLFGSVNNKLACLNSVLYQNNLTFQEVAFIGDELNDVCLLGKIGVFFAPANANLYIQSKADIVLKTLGGHGVLREVSEILLSAQKRLENIISLYVNSKLSDSNVKDIWIVI